MRITRRLEFDAGHRIPDHASQCRHLHGHRYAIEVTPGVYVSRDARLLEDISQGQGPKDFLFMLGYAGWGAGQLEGELIDLLNFLEFVSGLTRRGLVSRRDIDWMFSNFIDRVVGVDFVRAYVLRSDFDELVLACKRVERAR